MITFPQDPYEKMRAACDLALEALADMVAQHCAIGNKGLLFHGFLSANENALRVLEKAGIVKRVSGEKWKFREKP